MTVTDERAGWDTAVRYAEEVGSAVAIIQALLDGDRSLKKWARDRARSWITANDPHLRDQSSKGAR